MTEKIIAIDRLPYYQGEKIDIQKLATIKLGVRPLKDARVKARLIVYREKISDSKGGH